MVFNEGKGQNAIAALGAILALIGGLLFGLGFMDIVNGKEGLGQVLIGALMMVFGFALMKIG